MLKSILAAVAVHNVIFTVISPRARRGKEALELKRTEALWSEHVDLGNVGETRSQWP